MRYGVMAPYLTSAMPWWTLNTAPPDSEGVASLYLLDRRPDLKAMTSPEYTLDEFKRVCVCGTEPTTAVI